MRESRAGSLRFVLVASAVSLSLLAQIFLREGGLQWAVAPLAIAVACLALESVRGRGKRADSNAGAGGAASPRQLPLDIRARRAEWGFRLWGVEFTRSDLGWASIIGSCFLMLVSLGDFGRENPESLALAWYTFGVSVIFLLAGIGAIDERVSDLFSRVRAKGEFRIELRSLVPWLALGAVLIVALGVRLYDLEDTPPGVWYDEAINLSLARQYIAEPGRIPVYEPATNMGTLFLMPVTAVGKLAGVSVTTGRLAAAAFGALGIVAVFALVRHILGTTGGLIAASLVAFMRWDIIWSRIGLHASTSVLFGALIAWLTLRAVRSGRYTDYSLAGLSLGLGMWFYISNRMFPLVVGFILLHYLAVNRTPLRRFALGVCAMVLVALFVAAPLVQFAATNSEEFWERADQTLMFRIVPREEWVDQLKDSLIDHAMMFNRQGDPNPRHNLPDAPMLDFFTGALFALGFFFALTQWRNTAVFCLPFWALFMTLPGVLTIPWESPQSLRSITVIPAVAALAAYPLGRLWAVGREAPWRVVRRGAAPAVVVVVAVVAYINVGFYFGDQNSDPRVYAEFSTDKTLMARSYAEQQSQGYSIWVSRHYLFNVTGEVLGSRPKVEVVKPPETLPLDSGRVWHGAAIYFEPRERGLWELTRVYYPDGDFNSVNSPMGGEPIYYTAFISREQLEERQGLDVAYTRWGERVVENPLPIRESVWHTGDGPDEYPYELHISGALNVTMEGEYEFALEGNLDVYVELDGRRILSPEKPRSKVAPALGLHTLSIRGSVSEPDGFMRLLWREPGGAVEPIPFSRLYRGSARPLGAVGRFYEGGGDASVSPRSVQITPSMDVFSYLPVIDEPHMAVWEGMLRVERIGLHKFGVEGKSGPVKLYIEDELIAQSPPAEEMGGEGETLMGSGTHSIRVEYMAETHGRSTMFRILWQPPDGSMRPIPAESLTPAREHLLRVIE